MAKEKKCMSYRNLVLKASTGCIRDLARDPDLRIVPWKRTILNQELRKRGES